MLVFSLTMQGKNR